MRLIVVIALLIFVTGAWFLNRGMLFAKSIAYITIWNEYKHLGKTPQPDVVNSEVRKLWQDKPAKDAMIKNAEQARRKGHSTSEVIKAARYIGCSQ
ncbi:hypothetical protein [Vibrio agarivorans]|uniref:hypothetical protein n=1 Tax=Vibrio agarivorans TaxID=153622 RepID=UPI0022309CFD|nr:hypothetical protein [Vibrio agarivorans]MDN3663473.1 hypothetical protein [Vibrio agarivorans]